MDFLLFDEFDCRMAKNVWKILTHARTRTRKRKR